MALRGTAIASFVLCLYNTKAIAPMRPLSKALGLKKYKTNLSFETLGTSYETMKIFTVVSSKNSSKCQGSAAR